MLPDADFCFQGLIQSSQFLVHRMEVLGTEFHSFFKTAGVLTQVFFKPLLFADIATDAIDAK